MFSDSDMIFTLKTIQNHFDEIVGVRSTESDIKTTVGRVIWFNRRDDYVKILNGYKVNYIIKSIDDSKAILKIFGFMNIVNQVEAQLNSFEEENNIGLNCDSKYGKLIYGADSPSELNLYFNYAYICFSNTILPQMTKLCKKIIDWNISAKIIGVSNDWSYIEMMEDCLDKKRNIHYDIDKAMGYIPQIYNPIKVIDSHGAIYYYEKSELRCPILKGKSAIKSEKRLGEARKEFNLRFAEDKLSNFKNTGGSILSSVYSLIKQNGLNEQQERLALLFSAEMHAAMMRDKGKDTFYGRLFPWYEKYLEMFSRCDKQITFNNIKFLIFVEPRMFDRAKPIVDKTTTNYTFKTISNGQNQLVAFTIFEDFDSFESLEYAIEKENTLGQIIQNELDYVQGLKASLLALCISEYYDYRFAIYSPGDSLELFANNHRVSNSYIREDLNQRFRSSWEANIARVLNYFNIAWDYESPNVNTNGVSYLPDFLLENNKIIEVKGFWDPDSLKKMRDFSQKSAQYDVYYIDADLYNGFEKHFGTIISNWEFSQNAHAVCVGLPVVGLSFVHDKSVFNDINLGDEVLLMREPENQYDKNAIAVYTKNNKMLGHIAAEYALIYSKKIECGLTYKTLIKKIEKSKIILSVKCNDYDKDLLMGFLNRFTNN